MWRALLILLAGLGLPAVGESQPVSAKEAERQETQDAAIALWPELADPQSLLSKETQRLIQMYEARKDPRLSSASAPMWIASEAAANMEGKHTAAESQQTAMRLYPELAVLDTTLNKLFRENYARLKEVDPKFFEDPRWPIKLGKQCALQLEAEKAVAAQAKGRNGKADAGNVGGQAEVKARGGMNLGRAALNGLWLLLGTGVIFAAWKYAVRRWAKGAAAG
jgi:hypothetical protein